MMPPKLNVSLNVDSSSTESDEDDSVLDHLCGQAEDSFLKPESPLSDLQESDESSPDVNLNQAKGSWVPDLTLRYPPTFSQKVYRDLIFLYFLGFDFWS